MPVGIAQHRVDVTMPERGDAGLGGGPALYGVEAAFRFQDPHQRVSPGHRNLGDRLKSSLDQVLTDSERTLVENRVIAQVRKQNRQPWAGLQKLLVPKRLFALTAATGLLLFVLAFFFEAETPSGPSAIVTSFQGEYSSVMIMETPETRNTIIWFDETT